MDRIRAIGSKIGPLIKCRFSNILGGGGSTSPLVVDALCCGKFLAFAPFAPAAETDIIVKKNYSIVSIGFLLSAINVKIKMLYYRVCLAIRRC